MSLEQVRDWLLDLHDNFNGTDPALDDFKFAAESIEAALRYRDEHHCDCAHTCKFCRDEQEKQA